MLTKIRDKLDNLTKKIKYTITYKLGDKYNRRNNLKANVR